jgi:hypothetical protein
MANSVAIVGDSGTGKSTSYSQVPELGIKGLVPTETVIINVSGKPLPQRGWKKLYQGKVTEKGNYVESSDAASIAQVITHISANRPDIKHVVIDDAQYIMAFEFMGKALEEGYKKFAVLGVSLNKVLKAAKDARPDLNVYFMWHPEKSDAGGLKMKTVGKMVDDYLTLEGLFTVILYTRVVKEDGKMKYQFVTNNDGRLPAKSPIGMFDQLMIPNDLGVVADTIEAYNNGD